MTLTKREEFAVWYTALLLIPERNLDYDSKQRMLRCAAVAIGIMDIIIIPNKKTGNLVTIGNKIISNKNEINKSIIN